MIHEIVHLLHRNYDNSLSSCFEKLISQECRTN
ncbi:hypothetical protein H6G41_34330 [Tolypothrix sp. FACHB-123]|nr:hypothetical protein [Tolypothrix sp. FACHB-123]